MANEKASREEAWKTLEVDHQAKNKNLQSERTTFEIALEKEKKVEECD